MLILLALCLPYMVLSAIAGVIAAFFLVPVAINAFIVLGIVFFFSPAAREWFFGTVTWPLLSSYVDKMNGKFKKKLFSDAKLAGKVLDLGSGTGANFHWYKDIPAITHVVAVEPNTAMFAKLSLAAAEASTKDQKFEAFHGTLAEYCKKADDAWSTFDGVVSTFVLCSVDSVKSNLGLIHGLLKHGGRFVFLEHVKAQEGTTAATIQRLLDPVWGLYGASCSLTHATDKEIHEIAQWRSSEVVSEPGRIPILGPLVPHSMGVVVKG